MQIPNKDQLTPTYEFLFVVTDDYVAQKYTVVPSAREHTRAR